MYDERLNDKINDTKPDVAASAVERLVIHPDGVVEMLNRLKNRPCFGATLVQPDHWTVVYAVEKGLLKVGKELCGPLRVPTGEKHASLTKEGRLVVGV